MNIWPGVCVTFKYFIPEHVCVFSLCICVVRLLTTQFGKQRYTSVLMLFVLYCLCGVKERTVQCFFLYLSFKSKGNEIQCYMNYGVCFVTYCVLFRVCRWIEFTYERCRNKNRKTEECRHSARYCMNCLRLPCRSDTSEIRHFSPFTFNKNMSPS